MTPKPTSIKHCAPKDAGIEMPSDTTPLIRERLEQYFLTFAAPDLSASHEGLESKLLGKQSCIKCRETLDGYTGTFQWGMVYGEGRCSKCGWPAKAIHRIHDDKDCEPIISFERILQYHPDFVDVATGVS